MAKKIMHKFRMSEISMVDTPAQEHARVAILKRRALTTEADGHSHLIVMTGAGGDEWKSGVTSWADGHSHEWITDESGNVILTAADGHTHQIATIAKNKDGKPVQIETCKGVPAPKQDPEAGNAAEPIGKNGEDNMSNQDKGAELEKKAAELQKNCDRLTAIVGLSADQRTHFDTLSGADQDAFLAKSSDERDAVLKNLADADPVVYTTTDGDELRKSAGETVIKMAKRADDLAKQLAKQEALAKRAELEKRASDEFPNLRGETVEKAALLGAVESISDEAVRGKVTEMLKAHDAGLGKAFERQGTQSAPSDNSPSAQLDDLAKAYAKDNDVDITKAYDEVLKTAEGSRLYEEHRAG